MLTISSRPTTSSPYANSSIQRATPTKRKIEGNPGVGSQIFGGMGSGGGQYYGGAATPEEGRANFQEKYPYAAMTPTGRFAPGSSFGQNYPTTYASSPFQNAQRPSATRTVTRPTYDWVPSIRPGQGGFRQTGSQTRTVRNPNYEAQMRDYNAMQLLNQYTAAHNAGKQANEQRYQDILAGYKDLIGQSSDMLGGRVDNLRGTVGGITDTLDSRFGDRYRQGMDLLQGAGDDERARIERARRAQVGSIGQNLTSRGLNNTTIAASMENAVNRNTNEAYRDLAERLRREQLATHTQLSGDQLAALQNNLWQGLGYVDSAQLAQIQNQLQLPQSMLDFMERRNDTYPSQAELIQLMMQLGRGFG